MATHKEKQMKTLVISTILMSVLTAGCGENFVTADQGFGGAGTGGDSVDGDSDDAGTGGSDDSSSTGGAGVGGTNTGGATGGTGGSGTGGATTLGCDAAAVEDTCPGDSVCEGYNAKLIVSTGSETSFSEDDYTDKTVWKENTCTNESAACVQQPVYDAIDYFCKSNSETDHTVLYTCPNFGSGQSEDRPEIIKNYESENNKTCTNIEPDFDVGFFYGLFCCVTNP